MKVLEEKIEENLYDAGFANKFLYIEPKAFSVKEKIW